MKILWLALTWLGRVILLFLIFLGVCVVLLVLNSCAPAANSMTTIRMDVTCISRMDGEKIIQNCADRDT